MLKKKRKKATIKLDKYFRMLLNKFSHSLSCKVEQYKFVSLTTVDSWFGFSRSRCEKRFVIIVVEMTQ